MWFTPRKIVRYVMNRLFVYGIFLGEGMRRVYGMSNPEYATVKDYITQGEYIVEAVPVSPEYGTALTGLVVDVDPSKWESLDVLETNYDRKIITTTNNERVYMYAQRGNR